jgi:hypothetical protein
MSARFLVATLMVAMLAPQALAQPPAQAPAPAAECSYVEIAATNVKDAKDASIDAELKALEKKLKKPPFTAWNTFKKLSSGAPTLTVNKPETLKLKQATASVMLRGRSNNRVELDITMNNAAGKRVLAAKPAVKVSDWLLLVVSKDDGNILALTCK